MIKKRTGRAESSKKRGDEEEFRYKEERIHEEYDRAIQVDPFFHRDKTRSADGCKSVSSFEIIMLAVYVPHFWF